MMLKMSMMMILMTMMMKAYGRLDDDIKNFSSRTFQRSKYFRETKFEIDSTGTNEGAETKNTTAKSVNIFIRFEFIMVFLIVS